MYEGYSVSSFVGSSRQIVQRAFTFLGLPGREVIENPVYHQIGEVTDHLLDLRKNNVIKDAYYVGSLVNEPTPPGDIDIVVIADEDDARPLKLESVGYTRETSGSQPKYKPTKKQFLDLDVIVFTPIELAETFIYEVDYFRNNGVDKTLEKAYDFISSNLSELPQERALSAAMILLSVLTNSEYLKNDWDFDSLNTRFSSLNYYFSMLPNPDGLEQLPFEYTGIADVDNLKRIITSNLEIAFTDLFKNGYSPAKAMEFLERSTEQKFMKSFRILLLQLAHSLETKGLQLLLGQRILTLEGKETTLEEIANKYSSTDVTISE